MSFLVLIMGFLFLMPLTGKIRFGHFVNVIVILAPILVQAT